MKQNNKYLLLKKEDPISLRKNEKNTKTLKNAILSQLGEEQIISGEKGQVQDEKTITITVSFGKDFIEHKDSLQEIRKLKQGIENSTDAIFITDTEGKITYVNPSFEKVYGFSKEETIGKTPRILKSGTLKNEVYQHFWATLLNREIVSGEIVNKTKDGRLIHIDGSNNPILDASENIIGFLGVHRDITKRKQLEFERQVLSEITQGVTATADLNDLLKLIHQTLKKVLYAENCFFALYNEKTEMFSFPYFVDQFDETPPPGPLTKSCISYVFRSGKSKLITPPVFAQLKELNEIEMVGSSSLSWIGVPLQTTERTIGVLVLQHYEKENVYNKDQLFFLDSIASLLANVIERRKAKKALKESEAHLQEMNATKDKFFSIISHDLKSPFTAIIGFSELLKVQVKEKNYKAIEEFAGHINESSRRAMDLLTNLLEWSRLQTGKIKFAPETINLATLVNEVTDLLYSSAHQKSIVILKEIPSEVLLFADGAMISTVLRNLITNSIKFTNPHGKIIISAKQQMNEVLISVTDNGIGIEKNVLKKLFRIEEIYSTCGTQKEKGTGLGLILCKDFIEKHGSKINAKSEMGIGSTFYFSLPCI